MATSNIASLAEVMAAQAFLRALGANWQNSDLIYAVVAWLRVAEQTNRGFIGNNPFNLLAGQGVPRNLYYGVKVVRITGTTPYGFAVVNQSVLLFRNLTQSLLALAAVLLKRAATEGGFKLIVQAARHGTSIDLLNAIALSSWDAAHYGYMQADTRTNRLYQAYIKFTGMQLPARKPPKPKKVKVPPRPRVIGDPVITYPFLDPFAARAFYNARRTTIPSLPGLDTGHPLD